MIDIGVIEGLQDVLLTVDMDTMVRWGEMDSSAMEALMEEFNDLSTDAILSVKTVDDTSTSWMAITECKGMGKWSEIDCRGTNELSSESRVFLTYDLLPKQGTTAAKRDGMHH